MSDSLYPNVKTVALYIRVSSEKQVEQETIETQRRLLPEFCQRNGLKIVKTYQDEGKSGTTISGRPDFVRFLADCEQKKFDAVVVYDKDRLSRDPSAAARGLIRDTLWNFDIKVLTYSGRLYDLHRDEDDLEFGIGSQLAAYENAKRKKRMLEGRKTKLLRGIYCVGGPAAYGYRWNQDRKLEIYEEEARWVRWIFERFLVDGWTRNRICEELNRLNVPCKRGTRWTNPTITFMLRNPIYMGTIFANRYFFKGKKREERPPAERIEFKSPAVVSEAEWAAIQERLKLMNKSTGRPATRKKHVLGGFLRCGECGMSIYRHRNQYHDYYSCLSTVKAWSNKELKRCSLPHIRAERLDNYIFALIATLLSSRELRSELFSDSAAEDRLKEVQGAIKDLKQTIARHKYRLSRLLDLCVDGNFDKDILYCKKESVETALASAKEELKGREHEQSQLGNAKVQRVRLNRELGRLRCLGFFLNRRMATLDYDGKRKLIEAFFHGPGDRIIISRDREAEIARIRRYYLPPLKIEWRGEADLEVLRQAARRISKEGSLRQALSPRQVLSPRSQHISKCKESV